MFDDNGDGKIQKNEFQSAIHNMGIPINPEEMDVLYMFVDLDGTGEIEYHEFIRRLRRSGVNVRKKEDDLLFTLYRAI
jgi:Ca2+-binding EF-hand superfamily protein